MIKIDIRCKDCKCVLEYQTAINVLEELDIQVIPCQNENCKDNKEHNNFVTANIELEKENTELKAELELLKGSVK